MAIVYLGLGSNLGERELYLQRAITMLRENGAEILAKSSVRETEPLGALKQPNYLNQIIKISTELSPEKLLLSCQKIEDILGRTRGEKWASRTIDIDILFYDQLNIKTKKLTIPHPGIADREFIQEGLKEIGFSLVQ